MRGWPAGVVMVLAFALIVATAVIIVLEATGKLHPVGSHH